MYVSLASSLLNNNSILKTKINQVNSNQRYSFFQVYTKLHKNPFTYHTTSYTLVARLGVYLNHDS